MGIFSFRHFFHFSPPFRRTDIEVDDQETFDCLNVGLDVVKVFLYGRSSFYTDEDGILRRTGE